MVLGQVLLDNHLVKIEFPGKMCYTLTYGNGCSQLTWIMPQKKVDNSITI